MVHDDVAAVLPTYSATLKMTLDSRALKGYQHQHLISTMIIVPSTKRSSGRRFSTVQRAQTEQRPGTGRRPHGTWHASMACRAMLAFGKASTNEPPPIFIRTITRHLGVKRAGVEHRPAGVSILLPVRVAKGLW
jgi:hypothetical protein